MKTIYKLILVMTVLLLNGIAIHTGYADNPAAEKVLSTKEMQNLAPATPVEADFNDTDASLTFDIKTVAPTTPAEADFSDSL